MDATSMHSLPPGVSTTRMPKWMFPPDFDENTRRRLRPDILLIEGLPLSTFLSHQADIETSSPAGRSFIENLKRHPSTLVHIVELGYTSEASYSHSLTRKRAQHNRLAHYLLSAGWKLASSPPHPHAPHDGNLPHANNGNMPHANGTSNHDALDPPLPPQQPDNVPDHSRNIHIILLGTSGIIYKPTDNICSLLGISSADTADLLRSMHLLTVRFLDTITRTRRRLERTSTTFLHLRLEPLPPDPP